MEGTLMERLSGGTISSKWRTRWCRVDSLCFYFGDSKDSPKLNTIPLNQIRELKPLADPKRFDIVLVDDSVQAFLAASKGEAKRWMRVINAPLAETAHITVACPLARGVMAADANGFSDPFCDLLILDANGKQLLKLETPKIMKTLDPVWDHVFYVSDELSLPPSEWASLILHFEVYDWDAVGSNDFLGQVKIPLGKVPQGSTKQEFYTLEPGQGITEVTGQLKLGVHWETPEYIQKKASFQFGRSIQALPSSNVEGYGVPIPEVLLKMQSYLYAHGGLAVEGIFRLAPDEHQVDEVKAALNENRFTECSDVNCIAHLLKVWCRDLPTRLMAQVDRAQLQTATNDEKAAGELVESFVDPQASILSWFIDLCVKVSSNEDKNKMNAKNMAIVFAPNLGPRIDDPAAEHQLIQQITAWMEKAILHRKACGPQAVRGSGPTLVLSKLDETKLERTVEEMAWAALLRQLHACSELGILTDDLLQTLHQTVVKTSTPAAKDPLQWVAKTSPDTPYYFNPCTGETAWALPPGGVLVEDSAAEETEIRPSLIRPKSSQVPAKASKEIAQHRLAPRKEDMTLVGVRGRSPAPVHSRGLSSPQPSTGRLAVDASRGSESKSFPSSPTATSDRQATPPPAVTVLSPTAGRPPPRAPSTPTPIPTRMRGLTPDQSASLRDVTHAIQRGSFTSGGPGRPLAVD